MGESCRFKPSKQVLFLKAIHARCVFMFLEIVYPCLPFRHFEIIVAMGILCNIGDAIFIHVVANEVDSRVSETGIINISKCSGSRKQCIEEANVDAFKLLSSRITDNSLDWIWGFTIINWACISSLKSMDCFCKGKGQGDELSFAATPIVT